MTGLDRDDTDLRAVRLAKEHFAAELLGNPDVHGLGVGYRRRAGEKTDEYAVVVHVATKLPRQQVPPGRLLPAALTVHTPEGDEVEVRLDVQEQPPPRPETDLAARVRPVPGGVSAGGSGTLGGWVWDTMTGRVVALSNGHVFGTAPGTEVRQPSRDDGGTLPADRIASVLRAGSLDAAIAVPTDPAITATSIIGGGPAVFAITDATIGMRVQKTGRTTGLTHGVVKLIDYDSDYHGSHSDLWIDGAGEDFSDGGDSGALYLEADPGHRAVGLHWGGSDKDGVGHSLTTVFADLALSPIPQPNRLVPVC